MWGGGQEWVERGKKEGADSVKMRRVTLQSLPAFFGFCQESYTHTRPCSQSAST